MRGLLFESISLYIYIIGYVRGDLLSTMVNHHQTTSWDIFYFFQALKMQQIQVLG